MPVPKPDPEVIELPPDDKVFPVTDFGVLEPKPEPDDKPLPKLLLNPPWLPRPPELVPV